MYKPYNIDFEEIEENEINDRYLKCKKNTVLDLIEEPKTTDEAEDERQITLDIGMETISIVNNVYLAIILLFLMFVSYYLIKFLFVNKIETDVRSFNGTSKMKVMDNIFY